MLRYDQSPAQRRDVIAQRQAMLDTIADYRFLTPHKIAADERRQLAMAHAALSGATGGSAVAFRQWPVALRRRLGAALVEVGTRLQGNVAGLDPQPEA